MTSPYKTLQQKMRSVEEKVDPSDLEYNKLYPVYKIRVAESRFAKPDGTLPMNTICHFNDGTDEKFVYMPATYDNLPAATLALFRKDIENDNKPNLAFYGRIGRSNQLVLQGIDEEYDQELLAKNLKKHEQLLKRKREKDDDAFSPKKKAADDAFSPKKKAA